MSSGPRFLHRVREKLPSLHPTERRLAEFLLNFPGELASYTAAELARLANVSPATVSRFVQKLEYANYDEARRHVRADQRSGAALFFVESRADEPEAALTAHLVQAQANVEQTFRGITLAEIDALAQAILNARHLWLVGFRGGQTFAIYLQWQILQVVDAITVIPAAGQTLAEHLAGISDQDCVVIFGLARRITAMDTVLRIAQESGAYVAYISDEGLERDDSLNVHFRCQTVAPGPLFSHVSVMSLCHLIATRCVELSGSKGRKRLTSIESLHEKLQEI